MEKSIALPHYDLQHSDDKWPKIHRDKFQHLSRKLQQHKSCWCHERTTKKDDDGWCGVKIAKPRMSTDEIQNVEMLMNGCFE